METSYSIQTGVTKTLGVVDFVVFGSTLSVALFIGIYYAIQSRHRQDPSDFLVAGRSMGILPVSLSLIVTFLSALTLLGMPAEIYNYNTMFWWLALGMVLAVAGAAYLFNPVFYNMGITSVYEYLEMRFGRAVTMLASLNWLFQTIVYLSFVLYAPSLALKSVTGMELWVSILTVGGLVTLYTSMGGMKAVLWADSFQAVLILVGLLSAFIQGTIVTDGLKNAWEIASEHSRVYFDDFSVNPTTRHSFWSVAVGGGMMWMSYYAVNQCQIQRLLACPTLRKAQIAIWINALGLAAIVSLCCLIGVVMYAFYKDCHPLRYNLISSTDELLPLFVMDILGHLPGLPGIFLSCIFSGSLSSLSSGINALSAVVLQDYIRPFTSVTNLQATIITKCTAACFGFLCIGLAFVASTLGNVLQISYAILSTLDGPLFGIFILGMFFPRANKWGALFGYISGLLFLSWLGIGAYMYDVNTPMSHFSVHGCNWNVTNSTAPISATSPANNTELTKGDDHLGIYRLSYLYYTATGAFVNVVVGIIVSLITGYGKPVTTDPKLISPVINTIFPCLPKKLKKKFSYTAVETEPHPDIHILEQVPDKKMSTGVFL
ncbi:sodium-dependent multivitamin transporter-like [Haliotis cracherodii]|uniref:sodium-dependent multivitamin transporter-like n=1 Tax=Haliotis cracherodii TaxID=6455 RepID=UPI0039E91FF0